MNDEATSEAQVEAQEEQQATPAGTGEAATEEQKQEHMIPKARLDAEIAKRKELQSAAEELERLKKAQADDEAEKAGAIEKFKGERDKFEAEAKQWQAYATSKLDDLTEQLDDAGKAILEDLGDDVPLSKRLSIAEKLVGNKKSAAGFGSNGGGAASNEGGGLIPPEAKTSRAAYETWLANLTTSGDPELMMLLADTSKRKQIEAEARKLFG